MRFKAKLNRQNSQKQSQIAPKNTDRTVPDKIVPSNHQIEPMYTSSQIGLQSYA